MIKKIGIVLAVSALVFAGCSTPNTSGEEGSKNVVKVGVIAPLSGPAATYGEDAVNVFTDALEEYKATNPSVEVKLIIEDGKCTGKDATAAAQKLVNVDKVDVLLGGQCSGETLAAGVITNNAKIVTLSPVSSAPEISEMGEYIFRYWNDTFSAAGLGQYVTKNLPNIVLVVENTDYATAMANAFKTNYEGNIAIEEKFNSEEKDFGIISKKILQDESVDGVVLLTQSEATSIAIMRSFESEGILEQYFGKIIGAWFFSTEAFKEQASDMLDGLVEVQLGGMDYVGEKGVTYMNTFKENNTIKSAEVFALLDKEGIDLVLDAVKAGNTDSESIKAYFEAIDENNPRNGYFGEYYFDENGDAMGLTYVIQQHVDGEWKVIE